MVYSLERCASKSFGQSKIVCVCNQTYCDTIDPVEKIDKGRFFKYTSNEDGLRFNQDTGNFTNTTNSTNKIVINENQVFQSIIGFGGALTDSTCINILSLNENTQLQLMR